jgi:hypothetical protein
MKEIIVAALSGALLCVLVTIIFRAWRIERRARLLLHVYLICLCALAAIYLATPDDLGVLPRAMVVPSRAAGLLFCGFLYSAGFFGGVLQVYNLADRGLSLRMLIDISLSEAGTMTPLEMTRAYAAGKGLDWMYNKRLDGMVATGLARWVDDSIQITPKGAGLARLFSRLKIYAGASGGVDR